MLGEGGGDLHTLKRHGGWRSLSVAEGYIEESANRKVEVSRKLFSHSSIGNTTSTSETTVVGGEQENNTNVAPSTSTYVENIFNLQNEVPIKDCIFILTQIVI